MRLGFGFGTTVSSAALIAALKWMFTSSSIDLDFAGNRASGAKFSDLTITNSSGGYAETSSGKWVSFSPNTLRMTDKGLLVEDSSTNYIRNSVLSGVVAGSPGTNPTNTSFPVTGTQGLTREFIGAGTENGVEGVYVRYYGTASAQGSVLTSFDQNNAISAANGQTWTASVFFKIVAGSMNGVQQFYFRLAERDASTQLTNNSSAPQTVSATAPLTRLSWTATLNQAGTVYVVPQFGFNTEAAGSVIDITYFVGWPQCEQKPFATSPIRTTGVSASRATDLVFLNGLSGFVGSHSIFGQATMAIPATDTSNRNIAQLDDGSTNNRTGVYRAGSSGCRAAYVVQSGGAFSASAVDSTGTVYDIGSRITVAATSDTNNFIGADGGTLFGSDTSGSLPATINRLTVGSNGAGGSGAYIERVTVWKYALSPAELANLTSGKDTSWTLSGSGLDWDFTNERYAGYAIPEGPQLIQNGSFNGLANWTLSYSTGTAGASSAVVSGNVLTLTGDGTNQVRVDQSFPVVSGQKYTFTFDQTGGIGLSLGSVGFGDQTYAGGAMSVPQPSYTFTASSNTVYVRIFKTIGTATATNISCKAEYLTITNSSGGYAQKADGSWVSFAPNTLRRTDLGILVEEQRTNSIRNTSNFSALATGTPGTLPTFWFATSTGTRTVVGYGIENGIDYVDIRFQGDTNSIPRIAFDGNISCSAGATVTFSCFTKLVGGSLDNLLYAGLRIVAENGAGPATASPTQYQLASASTPLGQTRQVNTRTLPGDCTLTRGDLYWNASGPFDFTVRVGWQQLEVNASFATSPIPTTSVAATRAADIVYYNSASSFWNSSAGSLYVEYEYGDDPLNNTWLNTNDGSGTSNNYVWIRDTSGSTPQISMNSGNVNQFSSIRAAAAPVKGQRRRQAVAFTTNDTTSSLDGSLGTNDNSVTLPVGVSRFNIGTNHSNSESCNGYVRRIGYWNKRIGDAHLQLLTSGNDTSWILSQSGLDWDFANNRYAGYADPSALTVINSSGGYAQKADGTWVSFAPNTLRRTDKGLLIEEQRTNYVRNNSGQGAVVGLVGSGGVRPTNWVTDATAAQNVEIVNVFQQDGRDVVRIRFYSTSSDRIYFAIFFDNVNGTGITGAWSGVSFASSIYANYSGGTPKGTVQFLVRQFDSSGNNLGVDAGLTTSLTTTPTRFSTVFTGTTNSARMAPFMIWQGLTVGQPYDFTVDFSWPQLEQGETVSSPIRTTNAAATRAADNIQDTSTLAAWLNTNKTAYTAYVEFDEPQAVPGSRTFVTMGWTNIAAGFNDATYASLSNIQKPVWVSRASNVSVVNITAGKSYTPGVPMKVATALQTNDAEMAVDGGRVGNADVDIVPSALTVDRFVLGGAPWNPGGGNTLNGYIRRIAFAAGRQSNSLLQQWTT